jgi:TPR repeat protein
MQLAMCLANGEGCPVDKAGAFQWASIAAMGKSPDAMCLLGRLYEDGCGRPPNYKTALSCYASAAEDDHEEASIRLAAFSLFGIEMKVDVPRAVWRLRTVSATPAHAATRADMRWCWLGRRVRMIAVCCC